MRPASSYFTRLIQDVHIPAAFKPGSLRNKLRRKCNTVLAETAQFLRSLILESDPTKDGNETCRRRSVHTVGPLPESPALLPWMDQGMNAIPFAAQKRRSAQRRAEVLGMKNTYAKMDNNTTPYPEARDIRPLQLKTRPVRTLREMRPCGIMKREGRARKALGLGERRLAKSRSRKSNPKEDLDIFVIPPSVRRLRRKLQSKETVNGVAARDDDKFERADRGRKPCGKSDRRGHSGKVEEDRTVDCIKYNPVIMELPVCQKRRRGIKIKRNLEEPEHKLRRMG